MWRSEKDEPAGVSTCAHAPAVGKQVHSGGLNSRFNLRVSATIRCRPSFFATKNSPMFGLVVPATKDMSPLL